jgi:hypothetical protein
MKECRELFLSRKTGNKLDSRTNLIDLKMVFMIQNI